MKAKLILSTFFITLVSFFPINIYAIENELVIAQMNSCVNSLTNIINNKSMSVLEHETDQLLNNLTIQHIVELPEIAEFRIDLIDAIGKLGITEEEKALLRRINSIKQDNLKWIALSGALNNTMLITGGGNIGMQLGFQSLLAAARSAVEYKTSSNELQIEELQALWDLRKEDLNTFIDLRKNALSIVFSLYQKYNLKESDRLTEQSSQQFQKIISEPDAQRMVRLLIDNSQKFGHLAEYYYYLGMGYLDCGNFPKAQENFIKYEQLYQKAPIYREDEKSGLIALARLSNFNKLDINEIGKNIDIALNNLSSNNIAILQCALIYNNVLNNPYKALNILRSALDNNSIEDKAAIILTASIIMPRLSNKDPEYVSFIKAYKNLSTKDLEAILNMLIVQKISVWNFLEDSFSLKGLASRPWYRSKWNLGIGFFCSQSVNIGNKITFTFPSWINVDLSHIAMWMEKHEEKKVKLNQFQLKNSRYINIKDIEKVDCFKENSKLKYLYMESTGSDGYYTLKSNIDYTAIEREDYPRQSEFDLTEKDIKSIIKFLKKHEIKSNTSEIIAYRRKGDKRELKLNNIKYIIRGDSINLNNIFNTPLQEGVTYVRFIFDDVRKLELCYKYDNENEILVPCYLQYSGKRHFANSDYLIELGYKSLPQKEEDTPWYEKTWGAFTNWCSGVWESICNWFK